MEVWNAELLPSARDFRIANFWIRLRDKFYQYLRDCLRDWRIAVVLRRVTAAMNEICNMKKPCKW